MSAKKHRQDECGGRQKQNPWPASKEIEECTRSPNNNLQNQGSDSAFENAIARVCMLVMWVALAFAVGLCVLYAILLYA